MANSQENDSLPEPALSAFKLERFFAKHEFKAQYLACCSDCEPLHMSELLGMADGETRGLWDNLRLGYTETQGLPALRAAVAAQYHSPRTITADNVVILAPEEGIYLTMRALLRPGDEVVVAVPAYQSLYEIARSTGCTVRHWEPDIDPQTAVVSFSVQKLEALITPSTRLVVVNFPHNPTGAMLSSPDWEYLISLCQRAGCWLFSDEMYRMLELDAGGTNDAGDASTTSGTHNGSNKNDVGSTSMASSTRLPSAADMYSRAVSLSGCSKALALPGLRIGWITSQHTGLLSCIMALKDYTTICSSAPSEVLAQIAVRSMEGIVKRNLDIIQANISAVNQLISELPPGMMAWQPPSAGSVALARLTINPDQDIGQVCDRLVEEEGVLLLPATVLGYEPAAAAGMVRIGLGRKNLPECLAKLKPWLLKQQAQGAGNAS